MNIHDVRKDREVILIESIDLVDDGPTMFKHKNAQYCASVQLTDGNLSARKQINSMTGTRI